MKPAHPETEKTPWRLALSIPAVVVGVTPLFAFAVGLRNRWGYGPRFEEFLLVAKYVNEACVVVLLIEGALIRSYSVRKRLAAAAFLLAGIGAALHFGLYSER
jgi:hypothetical protein